uniref:Secreted protein n=1 Tax=Physcomitrium patens TaxID=3218 RepID=A0A2K1L1Y7_PHYPA|nr:hypothetical protein PHYPA_002816 [Physcomitrium patens]
MILVPLLVLWAPAAPLTNSLLHAVVGLVCSAGSLIHSAWGTDETSAHLQDSQAPSFRGLCITPRSKKNLFSVGPSPTKACPFASSRAQPVA